MANLPQEAEASAISAPSTDALEREVVDQTELHRSKQRRLLFAMLLMLFAVVLVMTSSGSPQAGVLVAIFALLIGLSGL